MKREVLSCILIGILGFTAGAQNDCSNSLYEAHKLYLDGKIKPCIEKLEGCLSVINAKEEKYESYKLLAKAYNDKNEPTKRDEYIKKLLKVEPNYSTQHNSESKSFNRAVRRFTVEPAINGGVFAGINFNNPRLIKSYSALDVGQRYNTKPGYQAGLLVNYMLKTNTRVEVAGSFLGVNYEHEMVQPDAWRKTFTENLQTYGVDLTVAQRVKLTDDFVGYAGGLFGSSFAYRSRAVLQSDDFLTGYSKQQSQNRLDLRNKTIPFWGICAGVEYVQQAGTLRLDIRYANNTKSLIRSEARLEDFEFISTTEYIYDDIAARLWSINISYSVPIIYRISN